MVPTSKHVREVYLGSRGVLPALKELNESEIRQTLCLDESTIEQAESVSVAAELKRTGAEMLDAPVSGGRSPRKLSCGGFADIRQAWSALELEL